MILIVPKRRDQTFQELIQAHAHILTKLRKVPFHKYRTLQQVAKLSHATEYSLYKEMLDSNTFHGFRVHTGQIYIHPDNYLPKMRRGARRLIRKVIKSNENILRTKLA